MSKIRVAVVGCGSVSFYYLTDMHKSPYVEFVCMCDAVADRAKGRAEEFQIPHWFDNFDKMMAGPPFDLLLNLTAMQSHFVFNLKALEAGRHVLSEKPIASTLEEGRLLLETAEKRGVRLFGAPNVATSPAFRCIAEAIGTGEIGRVHAANGKCGHCGPSWGPWFYRKGAGSLLDLGVYNITTLTGLLGPVKAVTALSGIAIPERTVEGEHVRVEADDNTMLLMDHGDTVFSYIQSGFVYRMYRDDRTIELIGTKGCINLLGHDWEPKGVEVWTEDKEGWEVRCKEQPKYSWEQGGSYIAGCLATGSPSLMAGEHAFHVLEVMLAALKSAATGRRVEISSRFPWPVIR